MFQDGRLVVPMHQNTRARQSPHVEPPPCNGKNVARNVTLDSSPLENQRGVPHPRLTASAPDKHLITSTRLTNIPGHKALRLSLRAKVGPRTRSDDTLERVKVSRYRRYLTFRDTPAHAPHNRFRHFELSLQSSLHPSINLLLRYRSRAGIQPFKGHTLHIKLQSQEALLQGAPVTYLPQVAEPLTGLSPSVAYYSKQLTRPAPRGRATDAPNILQCHG